MNAAASPPPAGSDTSPSQSTPLFRLPPELLVQVFQHLPAWALARVRCTCRRLNVQAGDDFLWSRLSPLYHGHGPSGPQAASVARSHAPFGSWREMHAAYAPYWFLIRHRLWFADRLTGHQELIGQLALATYDDRMGEIELLRLQAYLPMQAQRIQLRWAFDPRVCIFTFRPRVSLQVDDPVLRLEVSQFGPGPRLKTEVDMPVMSERFLRGMKCQLMLTQAVHEDDDEDDALPDHVMWPPAIVPHVARVRSYSPARFADPDHKPDSQSQVCETAFRTRMWTTFHGTDTVLGIKIGEEVATWSTIPRDSCQPTAEKPYQGIWVGDYAMHGPEFVLIVQKTPAEVDANPPRKIVELSDKMRMNIGLARHEHRALIPWTAAMAEAATQRMNRSSKTADNTADDGTSTSTSAAAAPDGHGGRLEAIKLTGDPHVPRGRYTFIAEDLGAGGLVRIATERPFGRGSETAGTADRSPRLEADGARVIRAWGQVGSRGHEYHGFMPAHLILDSPNRLALYWIEMGNLVWYRRVDWEGLLARERSPDGEGEKGEEVEDREEEEQGIPEVNGKGKEGSGDGRCGDGEEKAAVEQNGNGDEVHDANAQPSVLPPLRRHGIVWDAGDEEDDSD